MVDFQYRNAARGALCRRRASASTCAGSLTSREFSGQRRCQISRSSSFIGSASSGLSGLASESRRELTSPRTRPPADYELLVS